MSSMRSRWLTTGRRLQASSQVSDYSLIMVVYLSSESNSSRNQLSSMCILAWREGERETLDMSILVMEQRAVKN